MAPHLLMFFILWGLFFLYPSSWTTASQVAIVVKNLPANAGDIRNLGSTPGFGRSPGGWHCNPLPYFCLENPMDRGAWRARVHRVAKSPTWLKQLSKGKYYGMYMSFPDSSDGKEPVCNAGDPSLIPGSGRSPGERIGHPLQYSQASLMAQLVKNLPGWSRRGFHPWIGKIPWRRERLATPIFWSGEFHGLYSPWGCKESDMTECLSLTYMYCNFIV